MTRRALAVAVALAALVGGCGPVVSLREVSLAGLARQPTIAVEDVSDGDGLSNSQGVASELRRTGLFDRVERVATTEEADLVVRGTVDRDCEHFRGGGGVFVVVAVSSLIGGAVGSLAAIPHMLSENWGAVIASYALALAGGALVGFGWDTAQSEGRIGCSLESDWMVFRGGRPWRRYRDAGNIQLGESPSSSAMLRILTRRFAARLSRDLELDERAEVTP